MTGKNVIIVDDERDIVELMVRRMLHTKGKYVPLIAHDGYDALDLLKSHSVSAIILDLKMPNLDGISVCQEMMKSERLKLVPVIISSGNISEENREILSSLGVKSFLDKPYSIDTLFDLLDQMTTHYPSKSI